MDGREQNCFVKDRTFWPKNIEAAYLLYVKQFFNEKFYDAFHECCADLMFLFAVSFL